MTTTAAEIKLALSAARGLDLAWELPRFAGRELTLRAGERVVATLNLTPGRGSRAGGTFANAAWTIERRGPWWSTVAVREPGRDADVAVLELSMWGGGLIDFPRGGQFRWRRAGFGPSRMFTTYGGDPLVRLAFRLSWRRRAVAVDVDAAAWTLRELPVLLLLGGYLMRYPARVS